MWNVAYHTCLSMTSCMLALYHMLCRLTSHGTQTQLFCRAVDQSEIGGQCSQVHWLSNPSAGTCVQGHDMGAWTKPGILPAYCTC